MKQKPTRVLLSIKPKYADLIFNGTKKFEFRRNIFKEPNIKTVVVYASSPVQMVIGEFDIKIILKSDLKNLWNATKEHAGIDEHFFFQYFSNKHEGFAIKIDKPRKYKKALCLKADFKLHPPQSFLYLNNRA